jgi:hypothetical protein
MYQKIFMRFISADETVAATLTGTIVRALNYLYFTINDCYRHG